MTKRLKLKCGSECILDDDWYEMLSHVPWHVIAKGERHQYKYVASGRTRRELIHRVITDAQPSEIVDHINGDTLDNRVINLRTCNKSQNAMNSQSCMNSSSKFKGVWLGRKAKSNAWRAGIRIDNQNKYLGSFSTEEAAAIAYNDAAMKYFGEFASLNVIGT